MRSKLVVRVRITLLGLSFIAILLCVRLYFVQVVHGKQYKATAEGQYVAPSSSVPQRGDIFFTTKDGSLVTAATMQSGYRIAIQPNVLEQPETAYAALSKIVDIDHDRFKTAVAKKNDPYEEIAVRVSSADGDAIRALKITGVVVAADRWRIYPGDARAAQVLGFVGFKGDQRIGRYGIERQWESTLARSVSSLYVNFFAEIFSNVHSIVSEAKDQEAEGDVVTTIEPTVQQHLETSIDKLVETYGPSSAGGIIMDPATGEIVAMTGWPTFNPNTYNTVDDIRVYSNPTVEGAYELGSIMKALTMAAGIDAGVVTPATTYDDKGFIMKSGLKISNFDFKGRGVVPMQEVLSQSLNTGAVFVGDRLGKTSFYNYVKAYGLGELTKIDLPNEAHDQISSLDKGSDADFASATFGQSIAVTPIAMIRALAVLANKGILPSPHVVRAIRLENGITKTIKPLPGPRVLKEDTVQTVTNMLVTVVDKALVKGALKQEHHSMAAKTGTAQIAIPGGRGYYSDRYLHSFFGYFPAHDPKFIILLYVREPHGALYASQSLTTPFKDLSDFLINYYDIPPDR